MERHPNSVAVEHFYQRISDGSDEFAQVEMRRYVFANIQQQAKLVEPPVQLGFGRLGGFEVDHVVYCDSHQLRDLSQQFLIVIAPTRLLPADENERA
ncbi:MAG TPA: hypothetical protein VFB82_02155, partial [Blastocatellia bacterium]|nr:hypothetical protein [Blastocatellia bacterium]